MVYIALGYVLLYASMADIYSLKSHAPRDKYLYIPSLPRYMAIHSPC